MPFPPPARTPAAIAADVSRAVADNLSYIVTMVRGIASDPRVPQAAKLEASAALAYLVSGRGRIPSFIPIAGRLDAIAVAAFAVRRLLVAAGEPVLRSHWHGSSRALDALLATTSALASPGGRLRRLAVAGTAASFLRDEIASRRGRARRAPGFGRVVEGEVLASREHRR